MAVRFEPPIQQKLRFVLLARYGNDHVLVQTWRQAVRVNVRHEAVTVFLADEGLDF
jgi:hypothetical protein